MTAGPLISHAFYVWRRNRKAREAFAKASRYVCGSDGPHVPHPAQKRTCAMCGKHIWR